MEGGLIVLMRSPPQSPAAWTFWTSSSLEVPVNNQNVSATPNPQANTWWVPLLFFSHASVSRTFLGQLVGWLVGWSQSFNSVGVFGSSQSVRSDLWPLRHWIRVMRRHWHWYWLIDWHDLRQFVSCCHTFPAHCGYHSNKHRGPLLEGLGGELSL